LHWDLKLILHWLINTRIVIFNIITFANWIHCFSLFLPNLICILAFLSPSLLMHDELIKLNSMHIMFYQDAMQSSCIEITALLLSCYNNGIIFINPRGLKRACSIIQLYDGYYFSYALFLSINHYNITINHLIMQSINAVLLIP
jgi:hypothetical protein